MEPDGCQYLLRNKVLTLRVGSYIGDQDEYVVHTKAFRDPYASIDPNSQKNRDEGQQCGDDDYGHRASCLRVDVIR